MIPSVEIRAEPPTGAASRALSREYLVLLQDRLGMTLERAERGLATEAAFTGADGPWLVLYEDERAIGFGGLRTLAPDIGEIRGMFITQPARRSGHGRMLLRELERIAAESGLARIRLLTTEVLSEARRLYAAEGYHVVQRIARDRQPVEIWLEKTIG